MGRFKGPKLAHIVYQSRGQMFHLLLFRSARLGSTVKQGTICVDPSAESDSHFVLSLCSALAHVILLDLLASRERVKWSAEGPRIKGPRPHLYVTPTQPIHNILNVCLTSKHASGLWIN